jgi:hypothetical protein
MVCMTSSFQAEIDSSYSEQQESVQAAIDAPLLSTSFPLRERSFTISLSHARLILHTHMYI